MTLNHRTIEPPILYVGTPVALVTSMSPDGSVNIGPLSSAWILGRTVVLGWEATSQTAANLARDPQCVINFPDESLWEGVEAIATLTGHNPPAAHKADQFTYTDDKWTPSGFTQQPSEIVHAPRIAECPLQLEAEVAGIHTPVTPTSEAEFRIIEARVLRVHAAEYITQTGTHRIDTTAWSPLLYVFRDYFGTGTKLGASKRH